MVSDSFCMVSGRVWQMSGVGRCNIDVKQLNRYYGRYSSIAFSPSGGLVKYWTRIQYLIAGEIFGKQVVPHT